MPDLDKALSGAWLDCGQDLYKQLSEFGGAVKVLVTVQVAYEPVKPMANKELFKQYLSAAPTRIFLRDGPVTSTTNPYIDSLRILKNRIKEFNAKFIRDKSDLRLAGVLQFILKIVKYAPLERREWQPLPEFLSKKEAIINIRNTDERCFGYSLCYFLEREQLPERHCERASPYPNQMFQRHHFDTLPYPISPNDVHLYKDQLQMHINVFSFYDDEGRARHPLVISRKNYERVANTLQWNKHYALKASIPRLFKDITKHKEQQNICLRCLGHFKTKESYACHKELCTCDDFMSVLHVLFAPGSKQAQLKFYNYRFCTMAPFVIYADFESILEPLGCQVKQTTYSQQHKVCAAAAVRCSTLGNYNQLTVMKIRVNALAEFLDVLIEWESAIVEELRTNRPMKRMSAQKRENYENATECYICRQPFEEGDLIGPMVRDHDHITKFFIGAAHRQCNLERPASFRIPVFFHNFRGYDAHLIVHEFGKRPDREIKVIGQNIKKYLQVEWGNNLVFRDSL